MEVNVDAAYCYPLQPSIAAGETLELCVSTTTTCTQFTVDIYRQGQALVHYLNSGWLAGKNQPHPPPPDMKCNPPRPGSYTCMDYCWQVTYRLPIPASWPSGAYIAMVSEKDAHGNVTPPGGGFDNTYGEFAKALFVVRTPNPKTTANRILYKICLNTFHAYNTTNFEGGYCLYGPGTDPGACPLTVSMRRPGGGTGGRLNDDLDAIDWYDPYAASGSTYPADWPDVTPLGSPMETFEHWDAKMISWLEANGFPCDYCTDIDIHFGTAGLGAPYQLLISSGHDEYWTTEMVQAITNPTNLSGVPPGFVQKGGNVAFFAGNMCWWRISASKDASGGVTLSSNKMNPSGNDDQYWLFASQNGLPFENAMTGVSYRNGGGLWFGSRSTMTPAAGSPPLPVPPPEMTPPGYTIQHATHWALANAGLSDGDLLGVDDALVGMESDGAYFPYSEDGPMTPDGSDGTPSSFTILGYCPIAPIIPPPPCSPPSPLSPWKPFADAGFYGTSPWWAQGTANRQDNHSDAADTPTNTNSYFGTMGVMEPAGQGSFKSTTFTGATTDWARANLVDPQVDQVTRNVVGKLQKLQNRALLATMPNYLDHSSCYSTVDKAHHVAVADTKGAVSDLRIGAPVKTTVLKTFPAGSIGGIASFDDRAAGGYYRVAVALTGGLHELVVSKSGVTDKIIVPGAASRVAAHYNAGSKTRHYIVADAAGNLTDHVFPDAGTPATTIVLGNYANIQSIASVAKTSNAMNTCYVLTTDGTITEIDYTGAGTPEAEVFVSELDHGPRAVSAFYDERDAHYHVVVTLTGTAGSPAAQEFVYPGDGTPPRQRFTDRLAHLTKTTGYYSQDGLRNIVSASAGGAIYRTWSAG